MVSVQFRYIISSFAFLAIFVIGFVLQKSGKPYNVALFTLHKLISVGFVVFLVVTLVKNHRIHMLTPIQVIVFIITAVCFAVMAATGGLVSVEKVMPAFVSTLHKVMPYITVISTAVSLYLLS